jgi:integrase
MAGAVRHARIETRTGRAKLKPHKLHKQSLVMGRFSLAWRWKDEWHTGRWFLIRYNGNGKYSRESIADADDTVEADDDRVLNFGQAKAKALAIIDAPKPKRAHLTVRQGAADYIEKKRQRGQPTRDAEHRIAAHIIPTLGDLRMADLTVERLRRWHWDLANAPAFKRTAAGKPQQYKSEPKTEEEKRKRRASANRMLSLLKAILNAAFDEGHVSDREAWGRRVKPFEDADVARTRYLSIAEAKRLTNACGLDFRLLVQAALFTGARYGQLIELTVDRFNADAGTVQLRSRKGRGKLKVYNAVLNDEGRDFFEQVCAGRANHELVFRHTSRIDRAIERGESADNDKGEWREAEQVRLMRQACKRAKITPPLGFHQLRHTWASLSVMAGMPLVVVAQNLGHSGTAMVEKFYGHLAPSFVADAIRRGAPRFGFKAGRNKIVALSRRTSRTSERANTEHKFPLSINRLEP